MQIKTTLWDIELAVVKWFNPRTHIIVPNISWGMNVHECDLFIVTKNQYAYEVEIKTSKADLVKDKEKKHKHKSRKINKLYFAIPEYLLDSQEHIPEHAGILSISCDKYGWHCKEARKAKTNYNYQYSDKELLNLIRLSSMRIWNLKKMIQDQGWKTIPRYSQANMRI